MIAADTNTTDTKGDTMIARHKATGKLVKLPEHIARPLFEKGAALVKKGHALVRAGNFGPELAGVTAELATVNTQTQDAITAFMQTPGGAVQIAPVDKDKTIAEALGDKAEVFRILCRAMGVTARELRILGARL